jgi:hypothetical protein
VQVAPLRNIVQACSTVARYPHRSLMSSLKRNDKFIFTSGFYFDSELDKKKKAKSKNKKKKKKKKIPIHKSLPQLVHGSPANWT